MNPFGGFMQAVTGLVPGFGDKTGNIGKSIQGLPVSGDSMLAANDNTRSFLAWVQNYMESAAGADADGAGVFNLQPSDLDPDQPALDQLQALMSDANDQFSQDQLVAHLLYGGSLDNGHVPLPQGIINAIIAHHERSHFAGIPTHEALPDIPEMRVAKENTPAVGKAQAAGEDPLFQTAVSSVLAQAGKTDDSQIIENMPAFGQQKPAASGIPTQTGKADDSQVKARSLEWGIKDNRPEEGLEKGSARLSHKPAASAGDMGQTRTNQLIQERLPSGPGVAGKAVDPATPQLQPVAGQTKDPDSMVTGLTDQQSASSEDDTAGFRGQDAHHPAPRVELAEVKEEDWQKGQSSDSVKSTVFEQPRSQPSFQDTAKAVAGEPTATAAVKTATGQTAVLTRTEDAAVKSFQTTVMDQIVDRAAIRSIHGRSEVQIRLKPEFLGNVQMNIAADKEQLVVRIITDQPVVKEIIETHLHHLKTELHNQGLTIERFEVMVNPDADQQNNRDQFAQMFKHNNSQNGRRQPRGQDPETVNHDGGNNPDDGQPNRDGVNYFA